MKKKWTLLLVLALSLLLAACGTSKSDSGSGSNQDDSKLVVGASNVPHAEILEEAIPLLEEKGIELKIVTFTDYILPNKTLAENDLDANYFQHIPYLESQIAANDYDFVNAGGIHIEPIGVYSQKYKSLNELPKGAEIIMSNSVSDHGRMLTLLESEGLITLKAGVDKTTATVEDIAENKKDLTFKTDIDAALLPQVFKNGEGDVVLINSNYALDAGLNPAEDPIAIESSENNPYVNVIAVNSGDEDNENIKALVEVLRSEKIQNFILEKYKGSVVPVSE